MTFFIRRRFNKLPSGLKSETVREVKSKSKEGKKVFTMVKMTKITMMCLLVAFACVVQTSFAAPMPENHEGNEVLEEILARLRQLKQQSEGNESGKDNFGYFFSCGGGELIVVVDQKLRESDKKIKEKKCV